MDGPFDRSLRRLRRERAARVANKQHWLLEIMLDELLARRAMVTRPFEKGLLIGGPRDSTLVDSDPPARIIVHCDPAFLNGQHGPGVQCDEDRFPFGDGAFDLIVSVGTLDTVNDLPGALLLMRRALRPDGLLLAAFLGAGSLPSLRRAMLAADEQQGASPRIHPQIDVSSAGDLLSRAGFALPVSDRERLHARYADLRSLVADLRGMAGTNMLCARNRRPLLRRSLATATDAFSSAADADGRTAEAFEIIYLTGWAPHPQQPKPARRGSGSVSLTTALRSPSS